MWQQQHHVVGYQMIQLVSPLCAVFLNFAAEIFVYFTDVFLSLLVSQSRRVKNTGRPSGREGSLSLSEEFLVEVFHFIREEPLPVNPPRPS